MIEVSDIRIERLNRSHDISGFRSYEKDLADFLADDAFDNQEKKISVTYLWFLETNDDLVGYITLLNDRINLEGNLKTYFREKGIFYKSLPALKIGRLCVADKYLRQGIGRLMVKFAIMKADYIFDNAAGCRFITLDAKRNPDKRLDSIHFYREMDFEILRERMKGTTPMCLDLNKVRFTRLP